MKIVLNLQFWSCKKYSEHRSTVKNCNFSKLQFFQCTSTVIPLHIFAVYVKWNFSTLYGLSGSTTYPYLPQRRIDPIDPHSYPQGGVQIYHMANLLHKMWKLKYPPPNSDFWKNLTLAWFWPIIWHISNPEPPDTF